MASGPNNNYGGFESKFSVAKLMLGSNAGNIPGGFALAPKLALGPNAESIHGGFVLTPKLVLGLNSKNNV